jgi:DNA (cytosine-5)-methyltransferase 1
MGYHRAGFEVTGVDLHPMPLYPFTFHQGDALEFVREHGHEFDAIHASPPCQHYSAMNRGTVGNHVEHVDLVGSTRAALIETGLHYVIENVPNAPLIDPVMLCGEMFGLKVIRHRAFETNWDLPQPMHVRHRGLAASSRVVRTEGRPFYYYTVAGHSDGVLGNQQDWQDAMGIDWITTREPLAQAIPPAFTNFIGGWMLTRMTQQGDTP